MIENARALSRAGRRPEGAAQGGPGASRPRAWCRGASRPSSGWSPPSRSRLRSSFTVSHAMLLNVISRDGHAFAAMKHLLRENDEDRPAQRRHVHRAIAIYRALLAGGVVERLRRARRRAAAARRLTVDLQADFALNQPLSPLALAAIGLLDRTSPDYALDVLSVIESTLDNPRQVLSAQQFKARGEAVAAMKAEGIEYDERMDLLEDGHLPAAAGRAARSRLQHLPAGPPVGRRPRAVAQVGRPGHVRAGDDVRRVRRLLRAGPVRGAGAALPRRRLQGDAPDRAGGGQDRGAGRPDRVAGRDSCARWTGA